MKKIITMLVFVSMLLSMTACTSKETVNTRADVTIVSATGTVLETTVSVEESKTEVTTSESVTEETTVSAEETTISTEEVIEIKLTDAEINEIRNATKIATDVFYLTNLDLGSINDDVYYDSTDVIEQGMFDNGVRGWEYVAVNVNFAKTKEELYDKVRMCFTENFVTDEYLKTFLFDAYTEKGNDLERKARFAVINNILCVDAYGPLGGTKADFENASVIVVDTETVNVLVKRYFVGEDGETTPMLYTLKKSVNTEIGWRIDSMQTEYGSDIVAVDFENPYF